MTKFLRTFFITLLLFVPFMGICQIATPKWVDDIGGPSSNCISSAVKVDKQNNVYVTGFFDGTADFDPSGGVYNLIASGGGFDTFIAKYTSAGALIWAKAIGGSGTDQVNSMTVDINGNAIISGQYNSPTMTVGSITLQNNGNGDWDGFIVKLNTNGGFVWAKSIGGSGTDYGGHVSSDSQGNIIENLRYTSSSITIGTNNYGSQSGGFNGLTIKYDPNGNVVWAINVADQSDSESMFSEFDSQSNVVVAGHFSGNDNFNPLGTAYNMNGNGNASFIAKYNSSGILQWANSFNGTVIGDNLNLCINSNNDIYIDGPFSSPLTFGSTTLNSSGSQDIFIAKYSSAGVFQSAGDIGGGGGSAYNYGVVCSQDNYVYISGYFSGTIDFDPSPTSSALTTFHGGQDFFLAKYDANMNYKWVFNGGSSCDQNLGRNVAIDNNNDVLYTGGFCQTVNFSASTCNPYPLTAQSSSRDCFLAKYTQAVATTTAQITSFSIPQQSAPAVIDQTNLIITVTVPAGTNVTALVPTIVYTSGVTLAPASSAAQDFTGPVTYKLSTSCASLNYTVNVVFAAAVGPTLQNVCSGSEATFVGNVETTTPTSYLWQVSLNNTWINASGVNNSKDYTTPVITNATSAAVTYSYRRQVVIQGVTSYDSYYNVTVSPAILNNTITAPTVTTFCSNGDPGVITGSIPTGGSGTYTYQWQSSTDNDTFVNIVGAIAKDYDPSIISSTTYYKRVVTSGQCSLNSNEVTITITPAPAAPVPVSATTTVCTGSTATLSVSNPQAGVTYNWYDSATKNNLLYTGTSYTTTALTVSATYYIEAFNGSCTSSALASVQATVVALPSAPVLTSTAIQTCYGSTVTLTDNTPQDGHYNWYTVQAGGTPVATGVTFTTPAIIANTTYYVENVNSNGCISTSRTRVDITVLPLPTPPLIPAPAPICSASSATISITNPQADLTYNWYTASVGGTLANTGATFTINNLTQTTSYYVEAVNSNGCISANRTQVTVTVISLPAAPQVQTPSPICNGSSEILNITSPQTGLTYNWYNSSTPTVLAGTGSTFTTPVLTTTTNYNVQAISSTGGCSSTITLVTVTVTQPPANPVPTSATVPVCAGSAATLSVSNPQSGLSYNWYNSPSKTIILFTGSTYTTAAINSNSTFYVEAVNGPCTSPGMGSVNVTIIAAPVAPAVVQNTVAICSGTQAALAVSNPQSGFTYNWYSTETGGIPLFTGVEYLTPDLGSNTIYYVETAVSTGCVSPTRTAVNVTVSPVPGITSNGIAICPGTNGTVTANTDDANATITWYASNTSTTPLATGKNFTTPVLNNNTIYYAEAVDGTSGCMSPTRSAATVTMLKELSAPVVTAGATTSSSITFQWSAVDGATGYLVSTDGGQTFGTPSSGTSGLTHTITGLQQGTSVTLIVEATGVADCQTSGSSTAVTALAYYPVHDLIYVANTFTPNGDGVNDVIYVHSTSIKSMNFYVYDQWGEMLFKSSSQAVGWDGTYKGTTQPVGVYVYYVEALMNDGQKVTKKGTITLLK